MILLIAQWFHFIYSKYPLYFQNKFTYHLCISRKLHDKVRRREHVHITRNSIQTYVKTAPTYNIVCSFCRTIQKISCWKLECDQVDFVGLAVKSKSSHKSGCFIIIKMFLKIHHSQYTWVFYNIILFIILRSSFLSCKRYSFIRHSFLRSSFFLVHDFRLCAISLCDFQLFPIFDSHMCAHSHCELYLILVIIIACTLIYLFGKITLMILLLIAIFQLLRVSLTIFSYFLCSILVSKCVI